MCHAFGYVESLGAALSYCNPTTWEHVVTLDITLDKWPTVTFDRASFSMPNPRRG